MSLATKAAGSLLWVTGIGAVARLLTIVSTFVLTRFLAPEVVGEVNLAYVLVTTVGVATTMGVGQYIAAHPKEGRETAFHGTVLVLGSGVTGLVLCLALAHPVATWLHVPAMVPYVPGLALGQVVDRCGWVPRGVLVRDMRFRPAGFKVALGELGFATSSVAFASLGFGGNAIVGGNLVRSALGLAFLLAVTDRRDYLSPSPLKLATFRRMLRFGLPLTIAQFFRIAATTWDNSFMGYRFGVTHVGIYNQAYRLAELPAATIGDHTNDVLVPTFARTTDPAARRRGFLRAASLLALLICPMALGLGAIAPTLATVFYPPSYHEVGVVLVALAPISMARSLSSLSSAFLQVLGRTRSFIVIELTLVVLVLGFMALLAPFGPLGSSFGVALAFLLTFMLTLRTLRTEGLTLTAVLAAVAGPLGACIPMVAVVALVRHGLTLLAAGPGLSLVAEVTTGALAYAAAAFLLAPRTCRDFIGLAASLIHRRRAAAASVPVGGG